MHPVGKGGMLETNEKGGVPMKKNVSYKLLRRLAEEAWEQGDEARAIEITAWVDAAMLLQFGEGEQALADEVPLVVPADGADGGRLGAGVDVAAVEADPGSALLAGEESILL